MSNSNNDNVHSTTQLCFPRSIPQSLRYKQSEGAWTNDITSTFTARTRARPVLKSSRKGKLARRLASEQLSVREPSGTACALRFYSFNLERRLNPVCFCPQNHSVMKSNESAQLIAHICVSLSYNTRAIVHALSNKDYLQKLPSPNH